MTETLRSPRHSDLALSVKNRLLKIVGVYLRVGTISKEEIEKLIK